MFFRITVKSLVSDSELNVLQNYSKKPRLRLQNSTFFRTTVKSHVSDFRNQRSSELQYKIRLELRTEALTDKIVSKGKIHPRTDYEEPEVE